ncbi:MAG TPA: DUF1330 domain-containing protein [Solirubrobacteraceae bacterium]|jgi:uncharacterized protein (DUF1330 family)|nr:DUF1330 domain-containing protein [Solirubrobacteraceae bacterium]
MKYYAVGEFEIDDPSWVQDYLANVTGLVEARGGRYLARTARTRRLEGERPAPAVFLIIEWPSKEAADAFYESADYAPYRRRRERGARSELALVAGEDVGRAARIPNGHAP